MAAVTSVATEIRGTYENLLPPLNIYVMVPPSPKDRRLIVENHGIFDAEEWRSLKFADSAFHLADMEAGPFRLHRICPFVTSETLIEPGSF